MNNQIIKKIGLAMGRLSRHLKLLHIGLVLLLVLGMTGCPWHKLERAEVGSFAKRCGDVYRWPGQLAWCESVVGRYAYNAHRYSVALRNDVKLMRQEQAEIEKAIAHCRETSRPTPICSRLEALREQEQVLERQITAIPSFQRQRQAEMSQRVDRLIGAARNTRLRARMYCRLRVDQTIQCLTAPELIASYEPEVSVELANSLNRELRLARISWGTPVAVNCPSGDWAGADYEAFGVRTLADFLKSLDNESLEGMDSVCFGARSGRTGDSGGSANGSLNLPSFSGTGLNDICGNPIEADSMSGEAMISTLVEMQEFLHQECEYSPVASGGGSASSETVTDNGDGTETVCTGDSCYVRYKEGVSNSNATADDLNSECNSSGCTTTVSGLDQDNEPVTYSFSTMDDGTEIKSISNDNATLYSITTPDGTEYMMVCKGGFCSDLAEDPDWDADKAEKEWQEYQDFWEQFGPDNDIGPPCTGPFCVADCVDESCMSCGQYVDFFSEVKQGCLDSMGSASGCKSVLGTQNCCEEEVSPLADPTLVMPDPNNELMCSTATDEELHAAGCRKQCEVAHGEDCVEQCMSRSTDRPIGVDYLDNICLYAYWDACGPGGRLPSTSGGLVNPMPVPLPEFRRLHEQMTFPPGMSIEM